MTSYRSALEIIHAAAKECTMELLSNGEDLHEDVPFEDAVGRVAAVDHLSPISTPRFDNSAMDGYAVRSEATKFASPEKPLFLTVGRSITAGDEQMILGRDIFETTDEPCLEIMTGGLFPMVKDSEKQFDACIRIEETALISSPTRRWPQIMITKPVEAEANRRFAGEDIHKGQVILRRGDKIRSAHVLPLASVGLCQVRVVREIRVAVLSTGKELVQGRASGIPDVNGPFLMAALRELGAKATFVGAFNDNDVEIEEALRVASEGNQCDLILTTGGVSVGKFDFVASALEKLGGRLRFHGVSMRPGHPVLFSQIPTISRHIPVFGLPGNPGATAVCFRVLIVPFIRLWYGQTADQPVMARCQSLPMELGNRKATSDRKPPMTVFRHGVLRHSSNGEMTVETSNEQSPAKLSPFIDANCWIQFGSTSADGLVASYPMSGVTHAS